MPDAGHAHARGVRYAVPCPRVTEPPLLRLRLSTAKHRATGPTPTQVGGGLRRAGPAPGVPPPK
eukprot:366196-Chlamydomonas_euryale.AAC.16